MENRRKLTLLQLQVSLPRRIAITVGIMSVLILFVYFCNIPNPNMILIAGLVLCSALFGFGGGIVASVIMLGYTLFFFSTDHSFVQFTAQNMQKVFVSLIGIAADMLLVCYLKSSELRAFREVEELSEKLRRQKDSLSASLNNMPGMTFTKDAKTGVYLNCNQSFAQYAHKANPAGVAGLTDAQIFDAETAAHFVEDDRVALSMNRPYVFFEDVPDAGGTRRQLQTTKLKYVDADGRLCLLGMCQDVTDMVRIQRENAMTKEAYEKAVSAGVMYTQIAKTLTRDYADMYYVNCDTEEFIEYQRSGESGALSEARRGWHFFSDCRAELGERVYPDDRDTFLKAMARPTLMKALERRDTFILTFRVISRTSANGAVYVRMKVSRMENDENYIIAGITDVDAEVRDTMAKSEALKKALTSADQAAKSKSSFLAGMSHEIRTPMNTIIGLDNLALKKGNLDSETREYLEKIGDSSHHLLNLLNDILNFSRIESGRVSLRREKFSFGAMLEQVNVSFAGQCEGKGLSYTCDVAGHVDESYIGDEAKLKEILTNILSNAVKFTPAPGSVTLTVERTAQRDDTSTLRFRVKDTGTGMDPEFLPLIFEPFAQEKGRRKSEYGSTGLGMAITKRLVEMMNGTIRVESEKGVGTEVTVTLTLTDCEHHDEETVDTIDPRALNVLVVDDDKIAAEHAKAVLEEVGIRADVCTSGEEALHRLKTQHARHRQYNLVLMDWNMPGMTGLEASEEIKKQFDNETTVVVLTAYNWDDIRDEAHRVGVESFLEKPLFASNVIEKFEQIARKNKIALRKEKKRANLAGRRVLLAEDMAINAEIMMDTLEMENIKADHAENGRIAVEMFARSAAGDYAAILMDVRMPEMDGLEATRAIRAMDRPDAKRIPIIALTANAFDEDVQLSLRSGMNAHLSKPIEAEHLLRTLGELIYEAEEPQPS